MANRIVRDGILTSEAVNLLSQGAEVFYRRLMSVIDDYGRFFAMPQLLRANLYPLKLNEVDDKMILEWIKECVSAKLIITYKFEEKSYIQVEKFDQQIRQKRIKFPEPPL